MKFEYGSIPITQDEENDIDVVVVEPSTKMASSKRRALGAFALLVLGCLALVSTNNRSSTAALVVSSDPYLKMHKSYHKLYDNDDVKLGSPVFNSGPDYQKLYHEHYGGDENVKVGYPYKGDLKECPKECQYKGEQATEWDVVSGRACCQGLDGGGGICHLNGQGNGCDCKDVGLSEPCYIDTRCDPFQTWQDDGCKAKPGTQCFGDANGADCTSGYKCAWSNKYENGIQNKCVEDK